jgi:hypothetical protein
VVASEAHAALVDFNFHAPLFSVRGFSFFGARGADCCLLPVVVMGKLEVADPEAFLLTKLLNGRHQ